MKIYSTVGSGYKIKMDGLEYDLAYTTSLVDGENRFYHRMYGTLCVWRDGADDDYPMQEGSKEYINFLKQYSQLN